MVKSAGRYEKHDRSGGAAAGLDALAPDQVLVGKSASGREAVSEPAFRKKAKRSC
jgi:hypothetical protein